MESGAGEGTSTRLTAFRCWKITELGQLCSPYKPTVWQLGQALSAVCYCGPFSMWNPHPEAQHSPPPAPSVKGTLRCGIYAYDSLASLELYMRKQLALASPENVIVGAVELAGTIYADEIVDGGGYQLRAQYARVVALDKDHPYLEQVTGLNRVELASRRMLEAWAVDVHQGRRYVGPAA